MRRRLLFVLPILIVAAVAAPFAGPLSSGALGLMFGGHEQPVPHDLPESYEPVHKGGINLSTGLYTRTDEDFVLRETPHLILRRMYLSGYHVSRQFGIGTTHHAEMGLAGDRQFQWVDLYPSSQGMKIHFERTSPGRWFANAIFEHHGSLSEFDGAQLGWVGLGWAMRLRDGSRLQFMKCTPTMKSCPIVEHRDGDGHAVRYRRDGEGRLLRMETSADRWMGFDYDTRARVTRVYDSTGREVRYEYDSGGRLSIVSEPGGVVRRYTYTDRNQMRTIQQPDISIENTYNADGRCIRQVNTFPGQSAPYTLDFIYTTTGDFVRSTEVRRSDTTWTIYTFNANHQIMSETWGSGFMPNPIRASYERDPDTRAVTSITVTCRDRTGGQLGHTRRVTDDRWEWNRDDLIATYCSSGWRSRRGDVK